MQRGMVGSGRRGGTIACRRLPRSVGNAANIVARLASNDTGITGGIRLWDEPVWDGVRDRRVSRCRNPTASAAGPGCRAARRRGD